MVLKHDSVSCQGSYKCELNTKCCITLILVVMSSTVDSHLVGDEQHQAELKKMCDLSRRCFHDIVRICGKSVNEQKTFLDLCDLYEYSCEYNMVFRHVKDEEGVCPDPRIKGAGFA